MNEYEARDNLAARVKRMRAWQEMEAEDFLASDLEAVLTAAEEVAAARNPPEPEWEYGQDCTVCDKVHPLDELEPDPGRRTYRRQVHAWEPAP